MVERDCWPAACGPHFDVAQGCHVAEIDQQNTTIPIVEEVPPLTERLVETDRMRVRTIVEEHTSDIPTSLASEEFVVERRPVEREVESTPPPRKRRRSPAVRPIRSTPMPHLQAGSRTGAPSSS